jgi:serine/threonine protein kinase
VGSDLTQFGRYVILSELGRGAMGAVHRAVDPLIERDVAIKTLLPNLPPEIMSEVRERFLREARSAGRLNHPNIVTIYDVGEQDGVAYIAMELLEGKSLQQILREGPRLSQDRIADLVAQVADGLELAQRSKITHRDIKPANIMVSSDWRAKLTDFGVAHVASSSMTQTGSALGSPKYMSPEQVTGMPVNPSSDIFSLGVVLYEMLLLRTPFERAGDNTVFAVMHRITVEPHVPVGKIDPNIHSGFDAILAKALAKTGEKRYSNPAAMAHDLRHYKSLGGGAPATASDEATTTLIADLDSFALSFEQREQEHLRQEAAERQRKEEEIQRWAEAEQKRRQEFERQQETKAGGTLAGTRKSSALELLKQKVASKVAAVTDERAKKSESNARIDERLRSAFHFLSEFTTMLNEANPVSEGKQGVMYFGDVAGMTLCEGFTDFRTRDLNGKNCIDHVTFRFKVRFEKPTKLEVSAEQMQRLQERLQSMGIKFQLAPPRKNDFGQVTHAAFMVSGPFPCQAVLRGDYDEPGINFDLVNVRHVGPVKFRMTLDELTDEALDEFGTWVLGADDAFERFVRRS